jgi:hypothetical protein
VNFNDISSMKELLKEWKKTKSFLLLCDEKCRFVFFRNNFTLAKIILSLVIAVKKVLSNDVTKLLSINIFRRTKNLLRKLELLMKLFLCKFHPNLLISNHMTPSVFVMRCQ